MTKSTKHPPIATIETETDLKRGIKALRRKCTVLRRIHDLTGDPPLRRRKGGFEGLSRVIVGQQVSVASADAIWSRLHAAFPILTAETIASATDADLQNVGLSRPKIRTLRAAAHAVTNKDLLLDCTASAARRQLRDQLTFVKGIGPWTADIYMMFCLGSPDAFAPGDLALQVAAQHAFDLSERPTADELSEMAEKWSPWRSVAARLLWSYYRVLKNGSGAPM